MTTKKELREDVQELEDILQQRNREIEQLKEDKAAVERVRDKHHRQIQAARSAFEDLKRALYPDLLSRPLNPGILGPFPGASPIPWAQPYTINNA